ncbi:hypothetical protein GBAR_LOCUS28407, partial [Geodia barretti]
DQHHSKRSDARISRRCVAKRSTQIAVYTDRESGGSSKCVACCASSRLVELSCTKVLCTESHSSQCVGAVRLSTRLLNHGRWKWSDSIFSPLGWSYSSSNTIWSSGSNRPINQQAEFQCETDGGITELVFNGIPRQDLHRRWKMIWKSYQLILIRALQWRL